MDDLHALQQQQYEGYLQSPEQVCLFPASVFIHCCTQVLIIAGCRCSLQQRLSWCYTDSRAEGKGTPQQQKMECCRDRAAHCRHVTLAIYSEQ